MSPFLRPSLWLIALSPLPVVSLLPDACRPQPVQLGGELRRELGPHERVSGHQPHAARTQRNGESTIDPSALSSGSNDHLFVVLSDLLLVLLASAAQILFLSLSLRDSVWKCHRLLLFCVSRLRNQQCLTFHFFSSFPFHMFTFFTV